MSTAQQHTQISTLDCKTSFQREADFPPPVCIFENILDMVICDLCLLVMRVIY